MTGQIVFYTCFRYDMSLFWSVWFQFNCFNLFVISSYIWWCFHEGCGMADYPTLIWFEVCRVLYIARSKEQRLQKASLHRSAFLFYFYGLIGQATKLSRRERIRNKCCIFACTKSIIIILSVSIMIRLVSMVSSQFYPHPSRICSCETSEG